MKRILIILCLLAGINAISVKAQIRGNNIVVTVTPDHKDWNYKAGETARFKVAVLRSGTLLDNVKVDYEAGPEMYPSVKKQGVTLKDGTMTWNGTMKQLGFYRLKVTAHVGDKTYDGLCTAAFSPEKLQPPPSIRWTSTSSGRRRLQTLARQASTPPDASSPSAARRR